MLTVWEAIESRRSIRRFAPDDVPEAVIEQLLEAARLAPSASNRQPWRFIVVKDQERKKELRRLCLDQQFVEEAPVVFVCFGDFERYSMESRKKRQQEMADYGVLDTLSGRFADPEYRANTDSRPVPTRTDLITPLVANTYIAIEHIVLMATALGLGSCWVGGFTSALDISRLFDLPDNLVPIAVVPVGYPAGNIPSQRPRVTREEILIESKVVSLSGV